VRANRVHHGQGAGVWAVAASPQILENDIWASGHGIEADLAGTNPLIRANLVHDCDGVGIIVRDGACPAIELNEIWANGADGLYISGVGTAPSIVSNTLQDGFNDGIWVRDGASPSIHGNTISGNMGRAIRVSGKSFPVIGTNDISKARR
jgi:parallel beta-helix repeat protein